MNTIIKKTYPAVSTKTTVISLLLTSFLAAINLNAGVNDLTGIEAPKNNVRIMHNQDGTYTEFSRSPDERVIERRTYGDRLKGSGDRVLRMLVVYRKDAFGKLRSGIVYDGAGSKLYRIVYGYHKRDGSLVAEDMFDARVKRTRTVTDPVTKKPVEQEYPVRYLRYRYNAQGRQMKPIVVCLPPGKKAEELFGKEGSSHIDPWAKNNGKTANPNARSLR
ncbi:MAG: hypothetical protein P8P36_09075 [Akkermansiaceae bacterium]|nr:hypothetical protein [Akkermansiaceae bacterium]